MNAGDVIQDRYLLEERLGKGGMGQVWRARDQRLERTVAIKLIAPQLADEPELLVRFLREAQSIARISHPNVVAVLDFGESDENPFLVMEYVPGEPLTDLIGGPMEEDKARAIITHAAEAAGAAHAKGIVHRDIKPANVIVTEEGRAKLVDFGIAAAEDMDRVTQTGTTIGSPHYISPEQARGERATPRSDVYSLGVVLYELVTGKRPFEAGSVAAVAMAQIEQDPALPSEHVEGLDPQLENIVMKCLEKNPADRYSDGDELARAVATGDDPRTHLMPAAAAGAGAGTLVMPAADDAVPYEEDYVGEPESPWRAIAWGALIGLVLLLLAIGAYALLSSERDGAVDRNRSDRRGQRTPGAGETTQQEVIVPDTPEPEEPRPPEDEDGDDEDGGDDGGDGEDTPTDEDTDTDTDGQGPDGEGPPGQLKKGDG